MRQLDSSEKQLFERQGGVGVMRDDFSQFWNPQTGIFDPRRLRHAIVLRGWTVGEFAAMARISRGCIYSALLGSGVSDRTAIRIFRTLAARDPLSFSL